MEEFLTVLDPTEGATEVQTEMAPRLESLSGKVLGIVNNSKWHSDLFLRALQEAIQEKVQLQDVVWIEKGNASLPMTDAMLEQLKACHAVVSGVGD